MKAKLLVLFTLFSFAMKAQVSQEERNALIAFYKATDGANWTNNTNWDTDPNSTSDVNTWFGVTARNVAGRYSVVILDLPENNLIGSFPDISKLIELLSLKLNKNSISGNLNSSFIPPRASIVNLSDNQFSGNIPDFSSKSRIYQLQLGSNNFEGTVSSSLFNSGIYGIWLNDNNISGELDFSDFSIFESINISNTNISFLKLPIIFKGSSGGAFRAKNTPKLAYVEVIRNDFNTLRYFYFDVGLRIVNYGEADKKIVPNVSDREAILKFDNNISTFNDAKNFGIENIDGEVRITQIVLRNYTFPNNTLPIEIGLFTELKRLTLTDCLINTIPSELGDLEKVETISFSNNAISNLPSEIGQLSNLKNFNVNNNSIINLPEEFFNLTNLETLRISNNPLLSFSSNLGNLTNLVLFEFNNTQVDLIPTSIGNLKKLETLEFANTKISLLPPQIGGLVELKRLVAAPNNIASIPSEFGQLTKLQFLDFASCELSNTPSAFANLTELETLYLNDNELQVVAGLGGFTKLKYLRLHNNRLGEDNANFNTDLPEDMSDLVLLEELTLYNNKLTKLPVNIGNLVKLTSLKLNNNKLLTLPNTIGILTNLKQLELQYNALISLPSSIGSLVNLTDFYIQNNSLVVLPDEFTNITNLQKLNLDSNRLTVLPSSLGSLTNLEELSVNGQTSYNSVTGITTRHLTSIPLSTKDLINLKSFNASSNNIKGLVDLSGTNLLAYLDLDDNEITDLKLGDFSIAFHLNKNYRITQNPFITCVEVPLLEITDWKTQLTRDNGVAVSDSCTGYRVPQSEREALIAFYNSTSGGASTSNSNTTWVGANWDIDSTRLTNVGSWQGVTTELINGQKHVTKLNLSSIRLKGVVPPEIKDLSELKELILEGYYFDLNNGIRLTSIAPEIGQLINLERFIINRQDLVSLPEEIGDLSSLTHLSINYNQLTSLPVGIGNFTSLEELNVLDQRNHTDLITKALTILPTEIGNITSLKKLNVSSNALISLPSSIGSLSLLNVLNISYNEISGFLDLSNLEVLNDLRTEYNNISNLKLSVSPTIFGTNINAGANRLRLNRNALGCIEVPSDELVAWQLSVYNAEGGIIDNGVIYSDNCSAVTNNSIPDLERDALITLYNNTKGEDWRNDLSGSYNGVTWVKDATQKRNVGAWYGVITEIINGQKHVTKVDLNSNLLDGTIPSVIKNLTQLNELKVSSNKVSSLPAEIGELGELKILELNSNLISSVPIEIGNLSKLEQLILNSQYNSETPGYVLKSIPAEINNIISLKRLSLSSNQLEGNLDFSNLINIKSLDVSSNQITGLKIGVAPSVFDNAYQDGYSNRISFSSNQYLNCVAVPQNTIADWKASSFATSHPNIIWGQDCSAYNNVPENEIQALVDIYNNLDGVNWTSNTNWNGNLAKAKVNNPYNATKWQGITTAIVDGGKHVTNISLSSNKLKGVLQESFGNLSKITNLQLSSNEISGALPTTLGNLTSLETLSLNNNNIASLPSELSSLSSLKTAYFQSNEIAGKLPDFTQITTLETLYISNNKFQFGDFEDEFATYQNLTTFSYTGQAKVGEEEYIDFGDGFNKTLEAVVSGTNNTYQWFKNGGQIANATNSTLEIKDATSADAGYYFCRVTNSVVTGLTIETQRATLTYDAALAVVDEAFAKSFKLYPNPVENIGSTNQLR